jgi:hypothetical protein
MSKDKYCGEVYLELTFWSNVRSLHLTFLTADGICRRNLQQRKGRPSKERITPNMEVLDHLFPLTAFLHP